MNALFDDPVTCKDYIASKEKEWKYVHKAVVEYLHSLTRVYGLVLN
jgi:hypothetical protein